MSWTIFKVIEICFPDGMQIFFLIQNLFQDADKLVLGYMLVFAFAFQFWDNFFFKEAILNIFFLFWWKGFCLRQPYAEQDELCRAANMAFHCWDSQVTRAPWNVDAEYTRSLCIGMCCVQFTITLKSARASSFTRYLYCTIKLVPSICCHSTNLSLLGRPTQELCRKA